jgi:hypothetical protein
MTWESLEEGEDMVEMRCTAQRRGKQNERSPGLLRKDDAEDLMKIIAAWRESPS